MSDQDIYLLYSEQFRSIDDNLDDLVKKAESFMQATQITNAWKQANLNYLKARNLIFSNHAAQITGLVTEFQEAQKSMKKALADLKHGGETIGKVTTFLSAATSKGKELVKKTEELEEA
ncbi:MAG: hypothetical protein Q8O45_06560 [Desulfurivibrionaceae bacterium]|nr:hypothetical protein [Desulfurivibrionaceae bacterium]